MAESAEDTHPRIILVWLAAHLEAGRSANRRTNRARSGAILVVFDLRHALFWLTTLEPPENDMGKALSIEQRAWLGELGTIVGGAAALLDAVVAPVAANKTAAPGSPKAAAPTKGPRDSRHVVHGAAPTKPEYNNYVALINGIDHLVKNYREPGPLDVSPSSERDLLALHRDMLANFRTALILVKSDPQTALSLWEHTSPALWQELAKSTAAGLSGADAGKQLDYVAKHFEAAGYGAAKRKAEDDSSLAAPDAAQMAGKLTQAEAELGQARELFEQGMKLGSSLGQLAGTEAPKEVEEIIEMVMLPGSIEEKLAYARKHGIAGTAVELVGKVTGATGTLIRNVGETGEKVLEARRAIVLGRGASQATKVAAEQLEQLAGKFKKLAQIGKALGTAASYAAVIADGIKLVSAIRDGDYNEALKAGSDLAIDSAPLLLGADVAAPLAAVVVVIKAELEVFKLAAAFIRYCKDEMVRQAAADFIGQCNVIASVARGLVADCELLTGASSAGVQEIAMKKASEEASQVSKGIDALASHLGSHASNAIGAYPTVVASLGRPAIAAMQDQQPDDLLSVADRVAAVFKGANAMAKYVKESYTN